MLISFNTNTEIVSYFFIEKQTDGAVKLLPDGHALYYPLEFLPDSKKIITGRVNFFNKVILENYSPVNYISKEQVQLTVTNIKKDKLIIYNSLDNCFGHAFLKLLYFFSNIDVLLSDSDILLIVPQSLVHFIKQREGLSVLVINLNYNQLQKCYILNNSIYNLTEKYKETFIYPSSAHKSINVSSVFQSMNFLDNKTKHKPCIVFYYRKETDRSWGAYGQHKKITKLFNGLKPFFKDIDYVVLGDDDGCVFPADIKDYRIKNFSAEKDFEYNSILNEAVITIGLTGSHMLFPSLLSKQTFHLIPTYKLKNLAEDVVFQQFEYTMPQAYKHLFYIGNYDAGNISPEKMSIYVITHFVGLLEKEYKHMDLPVSQQEWISENYPMLNYEMYYDKKKQFTIAAYNEVKWKLFAKKLYYKTLQKLSK